MVYDNMTAIINIETAQSLTNMPARLHVENLWQSNQAQAAPGGDDQVGGAERPAHDGT